MNLLNDVVRIVGLKIKNFRGIEQLVTPVPPGGMLFSGRNTAGKTSALEAIKAALEAEGVGPEAIRHGADKAEIIVDLGAVAVHRSITKRSTSLEVRDSNGAILPKPTQQLKELLGTADLDPLAFYLADAKERRRLIMAAMPAQVTVEDLNRWCGTTKTDWNVDGHGQEVLAKARDVFYAQRTDVNRTVDLAKARLKLAEEARDALLDAGVNKRTDITPEVARSQVAAIEREIAVLYDRRRQAEKRDQEAEGTRARVTELRAQADSILSSEDAMGVPSTDQVERATAAVLAQDEVVAELEAELAGAKLIQADRAAALDALGVRAAKADAAQRRAEQVLNQATELEAAIEFTLDGDSDPIAVQVAGAEQALGEAKVAVTEAERGAELSKTRLEHTDAKAAVERGEAEAERLDAIVTRLTKDAPAELAKRSNLIPGLELTPTTITLDGTPLDSRSGKEQMFFAVELAKRMNARSRILIVDDLQDLDPDQQPEFIKMAREGGWQLIGSLVARGDLAVIGLKDEVA